MKLFVAASFVIAAAVTLNLVMSARDAHIIRTAMLYEQCVKRQYGMTPLQWYAEHKKYPVCGN